MDNAFTPPGFDEDEYFGKQEDDEVIGAPARQKLCHFGDNLEWFRDGNALCIVRSGFVNLQESPAIFPRCPNCGSDKILPPGELWPSFSCDHCAMDFRVDVSELEAENTDDLPF